MGGMVDVQGLRNWLFNLTLQASQKLAKQPSYGSPLYIRLARYIYRMVPTGGHRTARERTRTGKGRYPAPQPKPVRWARLLARLLDGSGHLRNRQTVCLSDHRQCSSMLLGAPPYQGSRLTRFSASGGHRFTIMTTQTRSSPNPP